MHARTEATNNHKRRIMSDPYASPAYLYGEASRPRQHAFGVERDLRVGVRRGGAEQPHLLVALLLAGDQHFLRVDFLDEAGSTISAERVGAGDHATAILDRHRHLGVRN